MKININTPEFWNNQNIEKVEQLSKSYIYNHKHKIVLRWLSGKDKELLNIGVGNGYLEKLLTSKKKSIKLSGIDISDISIRNIKSQTKGSFKVANITKIPFRNESFDFITILDVLEHLHQSELVTGLKEVSRLLKYDGKLIISVPLNEKGTDKKANRHLQSFSREKMSSILKINNFHINEVRELFAFQKLYWMKSIVARIMNIKKPNLLIIKVSKNKQ